MSSPSETGQGKERIDMEQQQGRSPSSSVLPQDASLSTWPPISKDQKPYQCGLCSVTFDINIELVTHVHNHSLTKPYQCGYCKVSYDNNPELTVHIRTHTMMVIRTPINSADIAGVQLIQTCQQPDSKPVQLSAVDSPTKHSGTLRNRDKNLTMPVNFCKDDGGLTNSASILHGCVEPEVPVMSVGVKTAELAPLGEISLMQKVCTNLRTYTALDKTGDCNEKIKMEVVSDDDTEALKQGAEVDVKTENGVAKSSEKKQTVMKQVCSSSLTGRSRSRQNRQSSLRPYACDICGASFKVARYISDHKRLVHEKRLPKSKRKDAFSDVQSKQNDAEKAFQCDICGAAFRLARYVTDHKRLVHEKRLPREKKKQDLKESGSKTNGSDRPFKCDICGAGFTAVRYLTGHKRKKHKMEIQKSKQEQSSFGDQADENVSSGPYPCATCGSFFTHSRYLRDHERIVHKIWMEKPRQRQASQHLCTTCGSFFKSRTDINRHFCQPKECPVCGRQLKNKLTYDKHIKTHGENQYTCEVCGQSFGRLATLRHHQNARHFKSKPFKCNICQKGFSSRPGLSQHKVRHFGVKKHSCVHCGMKFYFAHSLQRHALTHTDIRAYPCRMCTNTYRSSTSLMYHMKHTHQYWPVSRPPDSPSLNRKDE